MAIILGIDIGTHSVRGALVRTSMRTFEVDRYVEVAIPQLASHGKKPAVYASALRELMQALPTSPDSIYAAVDGMRGSLRILSIPVATKKRAAEVIPFELESVLPFPLEEAVIDFQELATKDGELSLMTAAVPEHAVEETLSFFQEAELSPRELTLGSLSLEGVVQFLPQPSGEPWMLVHVDREESDVCLLRDGHVELCRTFDEGTASLKSGARAVQNALHQTLMKYRAEGGALPEKLLVMGEGALDAELVRSLGAALGIPAEAAQLPPAKASSGQISPVFGKALGLAGRALRRGKRIDLRKGKFATTHGVNELRSYALLAAACALALAFSYTFSVWAKYRVLSEERDALAEKLASVTEQSFGEKTSSVTRARELLEGGGRNKDPLPRFDAFRALGAISAAVPESVPHDTRKLDITLDEDGHTGKFELSGQIPDLAARDTVAEAIEAHECIEQLERGKTSTVPGQDKKSYLLEGVIACPGAVKKTKGGAKGRAQ